MKIVIIIACVLGTGQKVTYDWEYDNYNRCREVRDYLVSDLLKPGAKCKCRPKDLTPLPVKRPAIDREEGEEFEDWKAPRP